MGGQRIRVGLVLGLFVLAGGPGCDEDERKPCPAKGLGVETEDGQSCVQKWLPDSGPCGFYGCGTNWRDEACRSQLRSYQEYACSEPQLSPSQGYAAIQRRFGPNDPGFPVTFVLTNASTGSSDLVISKVDLFGDPRCSFAFDASEDLDRKVIPPGDHAFLRLTYRPTRPGEDHAKLRIVSNARNYNPLVLPVCGRAFPSLVDAGSADAGLPSDLGATDAALPSDLGASDASPRSDLGATDVFPPDGYTSGFVPFCKDPGDKIEPCHSK